MIAYTKVRGVPIRERIRPKRYLDFIERQHHEIEIEESDISGSEITVDLFEDENISLKVLLKFDIDYHPCYGKEVKRNTLKAKLVNAYDNEECEYFILPPYDKKEIENHLQNNLIIKIN